MTAPTILEVMDDDRLFGPFFRGASWDFWRMFLAALFALPMSDEQVALYQRHTGRFTCPVEPFKEACLVVGRRGGKSATLALLGVYLGAFLDYSAFLSPGEVATVAILASDRKQARSIFRYARGLLAAVPFLDAMITTETGETIALDNRVVIEITTASLRSTRGYTYASVLADESAFFRDDTGANPDTEIFRAIRPGLATIPSAILLNASSPYRRSGVLWRTYQRHYGQDASRTLVLKASTAEANSSIDPAVIAEAYADDPESAASEFGAEFRSDIADFVQRVVVEACIEPGIYERPFATAAGKFVAFIDASGGSGSDSMTCAIAFHQDGMPVLAAIRERKPPFSPREVVAEFASLLKSYRITRAESDRWGGDWVGESFREHGIAVSPSAMPRSDLYRELLPLLNGGRCALLDNERLVQQLCGLERRTGRSTKDSIDHAPGGNDDLANAVAGVMVMASAKRQPMRISADALALASRPRSRFQIDPHQ